MSLFARGAEAMRRVAIRDLQRKISDTNQKIEELTTQKKDYDTFIEKATAAINDLEDASGSLASAKEQLGKSYEGYKADQISSTIGGNELSIFTVRDNLTTYIGVAEKKVKELEEKITEKQNYLDGLNRELSRLWS